MCCESIIKVGQYSVKISYFVLSITISDATVLLSGILY